MKNTLYWLQLYILYEEIEMLTELMEYLIAADPEVGNAILAEYRRQQNNI